jgi:hypothetical protein
MKRFQRWLGSLAAVAVVATTTAAALQAAPSGVRLVSFTATRLVTPKQTELVKWKTGAEPSVLGFNVYRVVKGKQTKVNRGLVASRGSAAGAAYSLKDKLAKGVVKPCYVLESVDTTGAKSPLGKACSKK